MTKKNSYTFKLTQEQVKELTAALEQGNYKRTQIPHTNISVKGENLSVNVYTSGKCLIQGKEAENFVTFVLEPNILKQVVIGYDDVLHPEASQPHMGIDESGKGDFFGPLVVAAVYIDPKISEAFKEIDVRDSKTITSDKKAQDMATAIRKVLAGRFSLVTIGPEAYNRMYAKMNNVNMMLAWGHATAIETLLEKVPDCPRALSDQFGPARQIEQALKKKERGKKIKLDQMPRAESDPAVAAASILARDGFISALQKMGKEYEIDIPKGASAKVQEIAGELVKKHGPEVLLKTTKCHFRTADQVLDAQGHTRMSLGPDGQAVSKTPNKSFKRKS